MPSTAVTSRSSRTALEPRDGWCRSYVGVTPAQVFRARGLVLTLARSATERGSAGTRRSALRPAPEGRPMVSNPPARRPLRACAIGAGALLTLLSPVLASPASAAPSTRLTGEAVAAGLQPGNATMGWHDRAAGRSLPRM